MRVGVQAANYSTLASIELCRVRGWQVGDHIRGVSPRGERTCTIVLLYIGETMLVAKCVRMDGIRVAGREASWTLGDRYWRRVRRAR